MSVARCEFTPRELEWLAGLAKAAATLPEHQRTVRELGRGLKRARAAELSDALRSRRLRANLGTLPEQAAYAVGERVYVRAGGFDEVGTVQSVEGHRAVVLLDSTNEEVDYLMSQIGTAEGFESVRGVK